MCRSSPTARRKEVLIVGGGDCGIAEEVLKHKSVERLTQVEIDASVVEFSKEHFPEFTRPVLADERFELVIDDGMNYVAKTDRRFDVIIVDFDRSAGARQGAVQRDVLRRLQALHDRGGVMVTQNGVPFLQADELTAGISNFRKLFADGYCYVAAIPTYVGGHMAMGWATDNVKLRHASVKTIADRYRRRAALRPGTGRPRCMWRPSRCRASSPRRWRKPGNADGASRPRCQRFRKPGLRRHRQPSQPQRRS